MRLRSSKPPVLPGPHVVQEHHETPPQSEHRSTSDTSTVPSSEHRTDSEEASSSNEPSEPSDNDQKRWSNRARRFIEDQFEKRGCTCRKGQDEVARQQGRDPSHLQDGADRPLTFRNRFSMEILCEHLNNATAFSSQSWLQQPNRRSDGPPTLPDTLRLHAEPHLTDCHEFNRLPWKKYLAGGDTPFGLDTAESNAFLHPKADRVSCTFDVDSFIMHVRHLAIFKEGFNISYYPSFNTSVTDNLHVKVNRLGIHHTRHLCLGHSAFSFIFPLYILFPRMPYNPDTSDTLHLTDAQQRVWVDEILLPRLRRACPPDIVHHHPQSFDEARLKAQALMSETVASNRPQKQLAMHEFIPERHLDMFWHEVLERVGRGGEGPFAQFQDFVLFANAKDLKLRTKAPTFFQCRIEFDRLLRSRFDLQHADLEQTWVDIAFKDCPPHNDIDTPSGHTLLRRIGYLSRWLRGMKNSDQHPLIQPQIYQWHLTEQAGTARAELALGNPLRQGGIAFAQAYKLDKVWFVTSAPKHLIFDDPHLEGLAMSSEMLQAWYTAKGNNLPVLHDPLRQILRKFKGMKARVFSTLTGTIASDYPCGVRQEYRVIWALMQALDPRPTSLTPGSRPPHSFLDSPDKAGAAVQVRRHYPMDRPNRVPPFSHA